MVKGKKVNLSPEENLILVRQITTRRADIDSRLIKQFGSIDAVTMVREPLGKERTYMKCPVVDCRYNNKDINRHLCGKKHGWSKEQANLLRSHNTRMFQYLTTIRNHGTYKPVICTECKTTVDRIGRHLIHMHGYSHRDCNFEAKKEECKSYTLEKRGEELSTVVDSSVLVHVEETVIAAKPQQLIKPQLKPSFRRGFVNITPGRKQKRTVLMHKKVLKGDDKRRFKIPGNDFNGYYENYKLLIEDFISWLIKVDRRTESQAKQYANTLTTIWTALDPFTTLHPNKLADMDELEDLYFNPLLRAIEENELLPITVRQPHITAKTVRSRFSSINIFIRFLTTRKLFVGLQTSDIMSIQLKIKEMNRNLNPHIGMILIYILSYFTVCPK